MKRNHSTEIICVIFLVLVSCSSPNQETETPTFERPTVVPTSIPEPSATPTEKTAIPEPTKTPQVKTRLYYNDLPPGEYLLYYPLTGNNNIISLDGSFQGRIYEYQGRELSHDGKRVFDVDRRGEQRIIQIFDLVLNEYVEEIIVPDCFWLASWSPDEKSFVGDCIGGGGIAIYQSESEMMHLLNLLPDSTTDTIALLHPSWSPDGKWIAHYRDNLSILLTQKSDDGVYLTEASCIEEPSECNQHTYGPVLPLDIGYKLVWSPDSRYLAMENNIGGKKDIRL